LAQVRNMLDWLRHGDLAKDWQVVHIQNGFEKAEAYSTYGYRDIKVIARWLKTGYLIQIEFHLKSYYELMKEKGWKHCYQFARKYQFHPITDASQIMDMSLLPEIVDIGVEALNNNTTKEEEEEEEEKVEILMRLGSLKLRQVQMLSDDDQSLQKATLASKAVYYFDQAIRIIQTKDGFRNDNTKSGVATYSRLLIGLSQGLCNYDWAIYYTRQYYDNDVVDRRVELPQILFPEMNDESIYYGIRKGMQKAIAWLGESHPITLHAKYVKAEAMVGKEARDYAAEGIQEERNVLGYDHPMVFEMLVSRYIKVKEVWAAMDALNDIIKILQVNLDRLGIHHPSVVRLLLYLCVVFQTEENSFCMDAPGSKVKELLRILSLVKLGKDEATPPPFLDLVKYALTKTVHSPDASKLQVGARVAVWSWEYQNYWSGKVIEMKQGNGGGIIIHVQYDLPDSSTEWISPLRRHTLLLSHGTHEPTPLLPPPLQSNNNQSLNADPGVQVGNRMLLWYGFSDNSFYSATIDSKDEMKIKVTYDTNEHQVLELEDLCNLQYLVTTRNDPGKVESVKEGDHIYVYWDIHKTYWLGKVLGVANEEEDDNNKEHPTKFRIQFYSGDLHVCDLSKMKFYPEGHALF